MMLKDVGLCNSGGLFTVSYFVYAVQIMLLFVFFFFPLLMFRQGHFFPDVDTGDLISIMT